MRKELTQTQALLGGEAQQENQKGDASMKELTIQQAQTVGSVAVEFVRLYDSLGLPSVPWKFSITDNDWFWPVGHLLSPVGNGELWVVKKESPLNEYAREKADLVGIKINGELVFAEPEWNNQVLQVWSRGEVFALFEDALKGKYSGVAIEENWTNEEREKAEKWHRLMCLIRELLEDELSYGEYTFYRHVERYYSKWIPEFKDFFEKLARTEDRARFLKTLKQDLQKEGFIKGYFMYIYYP